MKHVRAVVLALRLLGVIVVVFNGLDIIRCLLGMIVDSGSSVAYMGTFISGAFGVLVGIAMMIIAGVIKKKFIN